MKRLFSPAHLLGRFETATLRGIQRLAESLPVENTRLENALIRLVARDTTIYGSRLLMLPKYQGLVSSELDQWERYYRLPAFNGGIVMDVGAGCGETVVFYLHWGASKVIAIESDPYAFELLKRNMRQFGERVETFGHRFTLADLNMKHDFAKIDIDGGEVVLLNHVGKLGPCIIESHERLHNDITPNLIERFQLKTVAKFSNGTALLSSD